MNDFGAEFEKERKETIERLQKIAEQQAEVDTPLSDYVEEMKKAILPLESIAKSAETLANNAVAQSERAEKEAVSSRKQSTLAAVISIASLMISAIDQSDKIESALNCVLNLLNCTPH